MSLSNIENIFFETLRNPLIPNSSVTLGLINIVGVNVIAKVCTVVSVLKLAVVGFLVACGTAVVIKGQGTNVIQQGLKKCDT